MKTKQTEAVWKALDNLRIELPSWGFANTGTRFGKFIQLAAASTIEEKFSDAAQVHAVTGACPTMALHVQWDLPNGSQDAGKVKELAKKHGVKPGSINPNVFQDQEYKYGSVGNPDESIRRKALTHILDCVRIAETLNCRDISPWFADGSNYPGTQSIRKRIGYFEEGLKEVHAALRPRQRLLVEYKPFEPAFYHTDIADWGMALLLAKAAGPQAYVLVDTGHHYQAQNIEQIVAWLLHHKMIGGFHFNDRRYADDDLTLGSIDPYQVFRIFHEILAFEAENGATTDIAFMVDQSHNLKGKKKKIGSNDSDGVQRTGAVRKGGHSGPRKVGRAATELCTRGCRGMPAGRVLAGCATHRRRVAEIQGFARRSHEGFSR